MSEIFDNDEKSIFENAKPFESNIFAAFRDVVSTNLPSRKNVVEAIPRASASALCRRDEATDAAYA